MKRYCQYYSLHDDLDLVQSSRIELSEQDHPSPGFSWGTMAL